MIRMKVRVIAAVFVLPLVPSVPAGADEEGLLAETGIAQITRTNEEGGVGFSSASNLSRFYLGGSYDVLAAGVGLGASWKNKTTNRYPLEIGLYVAPQLVGDGGDATARVSLVAQVILWNKIGVGFGLDTWSSDGGFSPAGLDFSDRAFFTLGYGLTNETAGPPKR